MNPIVLWIPGKPEAKPRPRACVLGKHAHIYQPKPAWVKTVKGVAEKQAPTTPLIPPVCVDIAFLMPRPKSHFGTGKNADRLRANAPVLHMAKPDRDNLDKLILDVLQDCGYFANDSEVVWGSVLKMWALSVESGAYVRIYSVGDNIDTFTDWLLEMRNEV